MERSNQAKTSATTEPVQELLDRIRERMHPLCVVCGHANDFGLKLQFVLQDDGAVEAAFGCDAPFEGYEGFLHGGVTASLLDGAMTNCLFAHGIAAVTGELTIRFHQPICIGTPLKVRAWIARCSSRLHMVEGTLIQDGDIKASGVGKFIKKPRGRGAPQREE